MSQEPIHIVCLDNPEPADYGGAIDMFYKIRALYNSGRKIILHYFSYNNRKLDRINSFCYKIYAYKRKPFWKLLLTSKPFIVSSRMNKELIKRLNEDHYPVLLEGVHCTGLIPYLDPQRKVIVRIHNDEAAYYQHLAKARSSLFKKIYYKREAVLLKRYQNNLPPNVNYFCLSLQDVDYFKQDCHLPNVFFLPCFIPWTLNIKEGKGDYCLYHGNLSVPENEKAVLWLKDIFSKLDIKFVVAGKNPSSALINELAKFRNIKVVDSPGDLEMERLIQNAQINLIPSFNNTGVKLKLVHALLLGRFCIVNQAAIKGSGIDTVNQIVETPAAFAHVIEDLANQTFTSEKIIERNAIDRLYNNEQNAAKLSSFL